MANKKKIGRPTKFNKQTSEKILDLATSGKTDVQIAEIIGVTERTINVWKNKNPDFFQSLKEAKSTADSMVEAALFARAIGYSCKETKVFYKDGKVFEHIITKHYPPDVTAQIFWLKNRQPEVWGDRKPMNESSLVYIQRSEQPSEAIKELLKNKDGLKELEGLLRKYSVLP